MIVGRGTVLGEGLRWLAMVAIAVVCYVWAAFAGLIGGAFASVLSPSLHALIELVVLLLVVVDMSRSGQGGGNARTGLTLVALGLVALSWLTYWPAAFVGWLYSTDPSVQAIPLAVAAAIALLYRVAATRSPQSTFALLLAVHLALTALFVSTWLTRSPSSPALPLLVTALATGAVLPAALVVDGKPPSGHAEPLGDRSQSRVAGLTRRPGSRRASAENHPQVQPGNHESPAQEGLRLARREGFEPPTF